MIINRSIKVSGGTEITDGIVVKARDSEGYATEVDFYGMVVGNHQFGDEDGAHCWSRLETVNFKNAVTEIGNCAFLNTNSSNIDIPKTVTKIGSGAFGSSKIVHVVIPYGCTFVNSAFGNCKQMITYLDERPAKNSYYTNSGQFYSNTALATVTLGSVGYPVIGMRNNMFAGCTQTGLTITIYTTGANADGYLSAIRNGATNATIIIKASEDTTYNDVSYAAGEVMITSRVEISFSILDEETSESLGTFTVNGGTAFAEWIGSGLTLDSGLMLICSGADNSGPVMDAEGIYSLRYGGAAVNGTDAIVSGADYTLHNDYA